MTTTTTDRITKQMLLKAPRHRVWRAIADSAEFGKWFQAKLEGPFQVGSPVRGRVTHPGYEHVTLEMVVERIDPERHFAYRWHPNALDPNVDYSNEPMTLVEFTLEDADGGTQLTITESGFDLIPIERRADAIKGNDNGWNGQVKNIAAYLKDHS